MSIVRTTMANLEPPIGDDAARFLDLMVEGEATTVQTFDDQGKRGDLARVMHGPFSELRGELHRLNAQGAGVFWMVNYGDGRGRTAANVTGVRCVFVDLDGAPLAPVQSCALEPHAIVETSPGRFHAYWCVADCELQDFKRVQRALAEKFAGDRSVCDLPRVMRLPGFEHCKDEPFTTRVISLLPAQPYPVADLVRRLDLRPSPRESQASAAAARSAGAAEQPVFAAGGRNSTLAKLAGQMRRNGLSAEAIESALLQTNKERCRPPLDSTEVQAIARSIGRYRAGRLADDVGNDDEHGQAVVHPEAEPPSWPEPMLPGAMRTPDIPADVLPSWLGEMAGAIALNTQTPPALAVMCCMSVLATVLHGRYEVSPFEGYCEPLPLWFLGASVSGTRKTAVQHHALAPPVHWEKLQRDRMRVEIARANATRAVAKKRIERLLADAAKAKDGEEREAIRASVQREEEDMPEEARAPRLFTGDATAERMQALLVEHGGRMALHTDEAGQLGVMAGLYSNGQANLDVWLQGHAASPLRVDRAGRSAHVDRPAVTMSLLLQPGVLAEAASSRRFRDSGLLARFLYFIPASNVGTRDVRHHVAIEDGVSAAYESYLFKLLEGVLDTDQKRVNLPFTAAAREPWYEFAEYIECNQGEGGRFESISDWTSKLPGAVARIAALFELAETGLDAQAVGVPSVQRAVRLAHLLIPHAQAAFGLLGTDVVDVDGGAIVKWIRAGELVEFTRRDCQKAMEGRFRNVERLQKALARLEQQDVLREFKRTNKGAPPSTCYRVNPKVLVTESSLSLKPI